MSQSEVLGAVLIAGFLLWLAINKRLGVYWSLLLGGAAVAAPAPAASGTTTGPAAPAGSPPTVTNPNPPAPIGPQLFPLNPFNLFGSPAPAPASTTPANPNANVG